MSAPTLSEEAFQRRILEYCQLRGFKVFHDNDARRNERGWPDLVIGGPNGVLIRELKTDTGRIRPDQEEWLALLQAAGYDAAVWRPRDWERIVLPQLEALRRRPRGVT